MANKYHLKRFKEKNSFNYTIVDFNGNLRESVTAILIDDHYVLTDEDEGVFGVAERDNFKEAKRRVKEKAKEILEQKVASYSSKKLPSPGDEFLNMTREEGLKMLEEL